MANVIDGEASETDEEEDDQNDDVPTIVETTVSKKIIHVDERIQQHWKHLATNTQAVLWKRNQPAVKMAQEHKELTHKTFETVQSAATSLRTASLKLLQIEDGLADIRDAAALLPSAFEKTKIEIIKIL